MEQFKNIPKEFVPLFEARTAHEALAGGIAMLQGLSEDQQKELLTDPIFVKGVQSALGGLDDCRNEHFIRLRNSVAPKNANIVLEVFG